MNVPTPQAAGVGIKAPKAAGAGNKAPKAAAGALIPADESRALRRVEVLSPGQNLDAYLNTIHSIEILSVGEERRLARRFREQGDMEAARLLVLSHLRFVAHIARSYLGYGLPYADLVQEGNIGLMKAVQHFDPAVGTRLISFAVHWIKSDIHEYVLRNWSIVKIATTKAQRKLFFNLRSKKKSSAWLTDSETEAIAAELNVKPEEVREMEKRLSGPDVSLPLPGGGDADEPLPALPELPAASNTEPMQLVEAEQHDQHNRQQLHSALEKLDERSRDIIHRRWLIEDKVGLKDLAAEYGVSAERIRQIEAGALKQIRQLLAPNADEHAGEHSEIL